MPIKWISRFSSRRRDHCSLEYDDKIALRSLWLLQYVATVLRISLIIH